MCCVNGVDFVCERRDQFLRTQNSGVIAKGTDFRVEWLYDILVAVVELHYSDGMIVHLFKCRWFNSTIQGSTMIDHGMISVNTNCSYYEDEPFIPATHALQIFYIDDPKAGDGWKVVNKMSHRNKYSAATLGHDTYENDDPDVAYQEADTSNISDISSIRINNFYF